MNRLSAESIIKPLRPSGADWVEVSVPPATRRLGYPIVAFQHRSAGLQVMSAVEVVKDADDRRPEYHISISRWTRAGPQRCSSADALWVLEQFGCDGAEEDNHVPNGVVRNFFRPVADRLVGLDCECKADEPVIREDKGDYVWRGVTR